MDKTVRVWHFHAEKFAPQNPLEDIPDENLETGLEIKGGENLDSDEKDLDLIEAAILARRISILSASFKDDTITVMYVALDLYTPWIQIRNTFVK